MAFIGFFIFLLSYRYSIQIFDWIEHQTLGTRTYIMEKLEFLFIEVKAEYITYALLFLSFGLSTIVLGIFILMGNWGVGFFFAVVLSFLGWRIPKPFINMLVEKRIKAYQDQMVDAMTLLSNGIRAGLSMNQAIGMVVDEMPNPISQEFNVILQQNRVGVPLEECLENLAKRVPLQDNDMFVSSVNILKETGGNLAEVFDTIVDVIRERVRLQQKIDTFIAQGMFQGATVFAMPYFIGGIYALSDPQSMVPLFTKPLGWVMLGLALFFDLAGGFVILKIVKIKL
jgi:tight adherence protein B